MRQQSKATSVRFNNIAASFKSYRLLKRIASSSRGFISEFLDENIHDLSYKDSCYLYDKIDKSYAAVRAKRLPLLARVEAFIENNRKFLFKLYRSKADIELIEMHEAIDERAEKIKELLEEDQ